jgi:mRNA interferase YafQ
MKKSEVKGRLIGNSKYKYTVEFTNLFKKDVVNAEKRGLNLDLLGTALKILAAEGTLPPEYKPHPLHNNYQDYMECHIQPDWLLVWKQNEDVLILLLTNTGTHAYIFGW